MRPRLLLSGKPDLAGEMAVFLSAALGLHFPN
jgi:hypothetical protein